MDDEREQMPVDSLNIQVFNHQSLKYNLPVIEHAGSSGKGFPYAPEDFPSPGDVWTWRVGKRCTPAGFWQDKSLRPPDHLQSSWGNTVSFRGRASLEQYIRETFPDADVNAFFASFVWKIPCTNVAKDASLKAIKRKGCSKSAAIVRPGDCKASNELCLIKAKTGSSFAPATCNICCTEPNFCRNCCCILCSKTINWIYDGYSFIKCEALVDEKFICGHVAHIECALRAYLAGKVGGSIDLDAQYYCRCCDNKIDLLLHVQKIIKVSESIDNRDDMVKVLNLGFCMLRGSRKERAEKLRNHIATSIEKLKHGVLSEDIREKRSVISEHGQGSMEKKKYMFQSLEENVSRRLRRRLDTYHQSGGRDTESSYRSDRRDDLPPDNVSHASPPGSIPLQHLAPSHSSLSSDHMHHKSGSEASHHRAGKKPIESPVVTAEEQFAADARMAEFMEQFPDICFDRVMDVPDLKYIPPEVMDMAMATINNIRDQYDEWVRVAEAISKVSGKRKLEIDNLKLLEAEAKKKAEDAIKVLESERTKHRDEIDALKKKVNELSTKLESEIEEKNEACLQAQKYREKLVAARKQRDEAVACANDVDALVKREVEAAEKQMMERLEPLLIKYNANVLKFRNLEWLGDDYPRALALAWEQVVTEEKEILKGGKVDLAQLEKEVLVGDEPRVLRKGELILYWERDAAVQEDIGEGCGSK